MSAVPGGEDLRFGTKEDVAKMLRITKRAVDQYLAEGMPCLRLNARVLRFDLEDVRRWFKAKYGSGS